MGMMGRAELTASGSGRDLVIDPDGISAKKRLSTPLAKLYFQSPPNAVIAVTQDFVYQAFRFAGGPALSRPIDEKILFGDESAASDIEGVLLSPSVTVLLTRSHRVNSIAPSWFKTHPWD